MSPAGGATRPGVSLSIPRVRVALRMGSARSAGGGAERTRAYAFRSPPCGPVRLGARSVPGPGADRTRAPAPNEPNLPRRTNPIPGADRTQSPAPNDPDPPHRADPRPGAERTRASALRSPPCGIVRDPTRGRGPGVGSAGEQIVKDHPSLSWAEARAFSESAARGRDAGPRAGGATRGRTDPGFERHTPGPLPPALREPDPLIGWPAAAPRRPAAGSRAATRPPAPTRPAAGARPPRAPGSPARGIPRTAPGCTRRPS